MEPTRLIHIYTGVSVSKQIWLSYKLHFELLYVAKVCKAALV